LTNNIPLPHPLSIPLLTNIPLLLFLTFLKKVVEGESVHEDRQGFEAEIGILPLVAFDIEGDDS
jgi:hypothetical protein